MTRLLHKRLHGVQSGYIALHCAFSLIKYTFITLAVLKLGSAQVLASSAARVPKGFATAKDYKPGYVVLNDGDTVRGFIDYGFWDKSPGSINFSKTGTDDGLIYQTSDLSAFGINGFDLYERASFQSAGKLSHTVWLRILVRGDRLSLYAWNVGRQGFVIKERDSAYRPAVTDNNQENYKRLLLAIAIKYKVNAQLDSRIAQARYTEDDLIAIIKEINMQNDIPVADRTGYRLNKLFSFFIGGGMISSKLKLNTDAPFIGGIRFKTRLAPYVNIGTELAGSRSLRNFSLRLEAGYDEFNYGGSVVRAGVSATTETGYMLDQRNVSSSLNLLYYFVNSRTIKWFGGTGLGYNFSSYSRNEYRVSTLSSEVVPVQVVTNYLPLNRNWLQYNLRTGVRHAGHYEVVFQFARSSSYSAALATKLNSNAFITGLNYVF